MMMMMMVMDNQFNFPLPPLTHHRNPPDIILGRNISPTHLVFYNLVAAMQSELAKETTGEKSHPCRHA